MVVIVAGKATVSGPDHTDPAPVVVWVTVPPPGRATLVGRFNPS